MRNNLLRFLSKRKAELFIRSASSFAPFESSISLRHETLMIWGANTGVGKTLVSAGLCAAAQRTQLPLLYLKPVQTGFPEDSDTNLVAAAAGILERYGPHAQRLLPETPKTELSPTSSNGLIGEACTLFAWQQPISPFEAAETEGSPVSDEQLLRATLEELAGFGPKLRQIKGPAPKAVGLALIETAGGVASPSPSGTLQADLYRELRRPGLLVGDSRLGGISATVCAYESLQSRGMDVDVVVVLEDPNEEGLCRKSWEISCALGEDVMVVSIPRCPAPSSGHRKSGEPLDDGLQRWLEKTGHRFDGLLKAINRTFAQRVVQLRVTAGSGHRLLWWPFTQHGTVNPSDVTVIDARHGEHFAIYTPPPMERAAGDGDIRFQYDACASWWTQGVGAKLQRRLVQKTAYAAGRYGHVMFPENAHQPATDLALKLQMTVGQDWADRVFYSDNGSTAVEVALKMAFRKFLVDHLPRCLPAAGGSADPPAEQAPPLHVLGLANGYHGDTLGAMEAVAPSAYNGILQAPWYKGRGLFLDAPTVGLESDSVWRIRLPAGLQGQFPDSDLVWPSQSALFEKSRRDTPLAKAYDRLIAAGIEAHEAGEGRPRLAAALMEPVMQGAGGMALVDPLFQCAVADAAAARRIPLILDEVFTGFYRLGALSGAEMLGIEPDIACYAKLLTGGLVPLAATVTRDSVFEAFLGSDKLQALLHGHSFTAHAVGCAAARAAVDMLTNPIDNPNLCDPGRGRGGPRLRADAQKEFAAKDVSKAMRDAEERDKVLDALFRKIHEAGTGVTLPPDESDDNEEGLVEESASGSDGDEPPKMIFVVDKEGREVHLWGMNDDPESEGSETLESVSEPVSEPAWAQQPRCGCSYPCGQLRRLWDPELVHAVAKQPRVSRVVPLGTVFAAELRPQGGAAGYAANDAKEVCAGLRKLGVYARPLGNVVYLMVTPTTEHEQCTVLLQALLKCL